MLCYEGKLLSEEDWCDLLQKAEEVLDRAAEQGWRNGGRYNGENTLAWLSRLSRPLCMASDVKNSQESALCLFIYRRAPDALFQFLRTCERYADLIDDTHYWLHEISELLGYSADGKKVFPYPDSTSSSSASVLASSEGVQLAPSDSTERDAARVGVGTSARAMDYFPWNVDDWGLGEEERSTSGSQAKAGGVSGDELMAEVSQGSAGASSSSVS